MNTDLVIIPTYNEKENIVKIINRVFSLSVPYDILIIDDGSPDGTAQLVKDLRKSFNNRLHMIQREGKQGLGTAYITGFKWALDKNYDRIYEMDADFSHNPEDLVRLKAACDDGADLAIGSRYVKDGKVKNWPLGRILLSKYASLYVRIITWMPVKDTTAGFVCYKRKVLDTIDLNKIEFVGYAFQIEMKLATWKLKFNMKEVPITFTDRVEGTSKMSQGIFSEAVIGVLKMQIKSFTRNYSKDNNA